MQIGGQVLSGATRSDDYIDGFWQDLYLELPDISAKAGEYFTVEMDKERAVGHQRQFAELAHTHLGKTSVGALHYFRDQAKHHQPGYTPDRDILQPTIVGQCIGGHKETAAFTRPVAQNQHQGFFIPILITGVDL